MQRFSNQRRASNFITAAVVITALFVLAPHDARADDSAVQTALEKPLLTPGQVLAQLRAFIEPKIPAPPRPADRAAWEKTAAQIRRDMLEQVVFRGAAARWRNAACRVEWLDTIDGGAGYRIRKFRYEALPGMWIPALLYQPENLSGDVPVAMHVNGHAAEGKSVHYKQLRSINLAKRGMLVVDLEWFGMGQLRTSGFEHGRMNQLDLCGAGGLAPFYLALERGLDVAVSLEHADRSRVVVSGLSGGGWQTILISSLDQRVTLANPVAGYGGLRTNILFDDMGDSEQAPSDMGLVADYTHLTAMRAPRPTLLTYNAGDECCFKSGHTLEPLLAAARPAFGLFGAENRLRSHVNHVPGTHNFERENREKLYAAIGDYFYPNDNRFARGEIASEKELKTAEQLNVPLPPENVDFHRLAMKLIDPLPRLDALPTDKSTTESWQRGKREELKALLRVPNYEASIANRNALEQSTSLLYKIGDDWTVPATAPAPTVDATKGTALVVTDEGRGKSGALVDRLLADGYRVVAVDPLFLGESMVKSRDPEYTYPLFLATVGQRALGIQAAQLAALARFSRTESPNAPVTLVAVGPRASAAALVATAIEPEAIAGAELAGSLASFKELVEQDRKVEELPELFAFGLLAEFDVCQIAALAAPRPVKFREPSERARKELEPLAAWYTLLGASFRPID